MNKPVNQRMENHVDLEVMKDFCGEKLAEGLTQAELAGELTALAKKEPKKWMIGDNPHVSPQKIAYYLKKWGLVEKREKQMDFMDIQAKSPSSPYVMVMVPQDRLTTVLGVL